MLESIEPFLIPLWKCETNATKAHKNKNEYYEYTIQTLVLFGFLFSLYLPHRKPNEDLRKSADIKHLAGNKYSE